MNYIDEIENLPFHSLMTILADLQRFQDVLIDTNPFNSDDYCLVTEKISMVLSQMKILSFGVAFKRARN